MYTFPFCLTVFSTFSDSQLIKIHIFFACGGLILLLKKNHIEKLILKIFARGELISLWISIDYLLGKLLLILIWLSSFYVHPMCILLNKSKGRPVLEGCWRSGPPSFLRVCSDPLHPHQNIRIPPLRRPYSSLLAKKMMKNFACGAHYYFIYHFLATFVV